MQWNCPMSTTAVSFLSIIIARVSREVRGYEREGSGKILRGQSHGFKHISLPHYMSNII